MTTAGTGLYRGEEKMQKTALLFGIHMHQPVDNFDEAVEKAVKCCYMPFFETMLRYPAFKFSLHCSGWLLEKIRLEYPELFGHMHYLTHTGSIEWFGGGYYEPVLSAIPSRDRRAQIEKLSAYIKKYFGVRPQGLWLTERVWEASLVEDLRACGIRYAMVDDYHFISNGYEKEKMDGYYTTEDNGMTLDLFPIAKALRYALPFHEVKEALQSVHAYGERENAAAVIFDDAEKFGLWPDTHRWVYEKKWLEKFVEAVLDHPAIMPEHYRTYRETNRSLGLAYLDNGSYMEMGEWSLPVKEAEALQQIKQHEKDYPFKGGIWKNFFVKYRESNYLHKRMMSLSLKQEAFDEKRVDVLYRLQTNDVFWHGVFGGFYLPSLRDNAYRYLLEIEKENAKKERSFQVTDIDLDGYEELKVLDRKMSIVLSASQGAQMVEFGLLESAFNWQNTIMRREESYHHELLEAVRHAVPKEEKEKQEGVATIHTRQNAVDASLVEELVYDWHAKNSFIEHFSQKPFTLEGFKSADFGEIGDFADQPFDLQKKTFVRHGGIYLDRESYGASLEKKYRFNEAMITLKSRFETEYSQKLYFAQEFNLHFAHPQKVTFNGEQVENGWSQKGVSELVIVDDFTKKKLIVRSSMVCTVFAYILHTVSKSETGFEKIAQQISFIFTTDFTAAFTSEISLKVEHV